MDLSEPNNCRIEDFALEFKTASYNLLHLTEFSLSQSSNTVYKNLMAYHLRLDCILSLQSDCIHIGNCIIGHEQLI